MVKKNKTPVQNKNEDESIIPAWLRWVLIVIAVLALLVIATKGTGPFRTDFPVW